MAFRNPAVAGTYLVRAAIQSPNYISGSTGWSINRDGTSEFNSGTFRGSIEAGSLTGAHFWVNNPNTSDVIDVYNSSNKLAFSIGNNGRMVSYAQASNAEVVLSSGAIFFEDSGQSATIDPEISGSRTATATILDIGGGVPLSGTSAGEPFIEMIYDTAASPPTSWMMAGQRGINGALVQTDVATNANQMVRMGTLSGTTDGSGNLSLTNAASFPIKGGVVIYDQTGRAAGPFCSAIFNVGSTTLFTHWMSGTTSLANTPVFGFYMVWG